MRGKIEDGGTFRTLMALRVKVDEPSSGSFRVLDPSWDREDNYILDISFKNTLEMRFLADRLMNMAAEIDRLAVKRRLD